MAKKKDMAGKDDERQVRGKPGPASQARSEKNRRGAGKGAGGAGRGVPKIGKHEASGGDDSGGGLH